MENTKIHTTTKLIKKTDSCFCLCELYARSTRDANFDEIGPSLYGPRFARNFEYMLPSRSRHKDR